MRTLRQRNNLSQFFQKRFYIGQKIHPWSAHSPRDLTRHSFGAGKIRVPQAGIGMPKGRFAWSTGPGPPVSGCDPDTPKTESEGLSETFAPSYSYKKTIVSKQVSTVPLSLRFRNHLSACRALRHGVLAPQRLRAPGPTAGTSFLPARGTGCISRVSGCTAPTDCEAPAARSGQRGTSYNVQFALWFPDTGPSLHATSPHRPGSAKSSRGALPFPAQDCQNAQRGFATSRDRAEGRPGSWHRGTGWI